MKKHLVISGKVQGVGFRYWLQRLAIEKNICGWVKNKTSGNVEALIVGEEKEIQEFQLKKFGPEGEIFRKQSQLLAPVLEEVDAAIKAVAAQRGYDYVFDAVSGAIVYALDSHDLTEEVLKELKKSSSSSSN